MQVECLLVNIVFETVEGFDFRRDLGPDAEVIGMALNETRSQEVFERLFHEIRDADRSTLSVAGLSDRSLHAKFQVLISLSDQLRKASGRR